MWMRDADEDEDEDGGAATIWPHKYLEDGERSDELR